MVAQAALEFNRATKELSMVLDCCVSLGATN
jgi:hypothetical protein